MSSPCSWGIFCCYHSIMQPILVNTDIWTKGWMDERKEGRKQGRKAGREEGKEGTRGYNCLGTSGLAGRSILIGYCFPPSLPQPPGCFL